MKELTISRSDTQFAAMATVAKTLRMTPADTLKTLAFMPLNTDHHALSDFREQAEYVAGVVLADGVHAYGDQPLAGCIKFDEEVARA